jgi:hypothetical protein
MNSPEKSGSEKIHVITTFFIKGGGGVHLYNLIF